MSEDLTQPLRPGRRDPQGWTIGRMGLYLSFIPPVAVLFLIVSQPG